MYNFEFIKDGKKWHRVDKRVARKAYKAGAVVGLVPCQSSICSMWVNSIDVRNGSNDVDFDTIVNKFEYYNCNMELGKRAAYYVES